MSSTDTLFYALVIVGSISVLFMLSQIAVRELNPDGTDFYDCSKSILGNAMTTAGCTANGNYSLSDDIGLPSVNSQANPSTGNIFTDTFVAGKNWLIDTFGLGYVFDILSAPKNFLIAIGAPTAVAYSLAALWYITLLFLIVSWLLGR